MTDKLRLRTKWVTKSINIKQEIWLNNIILSVAIMKVPYFTTMQHAIKCLNKNINGTLVLKCAN